ncbi:MAG: MgtC/SapB family protein [Eubacteriales bacterium]|nr:MgtC/SapB family protein [Eubacteriales bacterium]
MDWLYEINIYSIALRLFLALLFGGIIGLERGANKHQAGLRTHILVCIGATLAMLTNHYIFESITENTDPARLGAQVISGIGFLGAGLILVTSRNKVKGLTTAAGLWASACIGLALGIGFYSGAIVAGVLVFIVLALLPRVEVYFYNRSRLMSLYIELDSMNNMREFLNVVRNQNFIISETQVNRSDSIVPDGYSLNLTVRIPRKMTHIQVIQCLSEINGVFLVEEYE